MFNFLNDLSNYDDRAIDRYEEGSLIVDTCAVSDGNQPFETGIRHPEYNSGKWIIVEAYSTKGDAKAGHSKWVSTMTNEPLPEKLTDCKNARVAQLLDLFGEDGKLEFQRNA